MQVTPVNDSIPGEQPVQSIEDPGLAPWVEWLDKIGFEDLWDDEI
jgi:hypothetical protein